MSATLSSREKIVNSAIDLISSKGFDGMSVADILELSGVTRSNFYYHFKTKEQLGHTVLDLMIEEVKDKYIHQTLLNTSLSPVNRIESLFDAMAMKMTESCCDQGCPFTNLATETSDYYPAFREKLDNYFTYFQKIIKETLDEGLKSGEFSFSNDPESVARLIISSVLGMMVLAKTSKKTDIIYNNKHILLNLLSQS